MPAFQLSGSLEEIPLPDIARLFQSTRKSGKLTLTSGVSTGSMHFDRGEIVDCQSSNLSGLDAIKHVALFNRGYFDFKDGVAATSQSLVNYETSEVINFLETRMQESRQLQELVPSPAEIPHYLGGAIPAGLEVSAADLAVALKASSGTHSVRALANDLSLDETMVGYTIARLTAAGLMEIVGRDDSVVETPPAAPTAPPPLPPAAPEAAPAKTEGIAGSPVSGPSATGQPRYWRGRRID